MASSRNPSATAASVSSMSRGFPSDAEQPSSQSSFSQDVALPPLLCGELVPELVVGDVAYYVTATKYHVGQFMLTNYRLYFIQTDALLSTDNEATDPVIIDLPLGFVEDCKKVGGYSSRGSGAYAIEVYCKDGRLFRFAYKSDTHKRKDIFKKLLDLAFPFSSKLTNPFAFHYKETFDDSIDDGWNVYDIKAEYDRLIKNSPSANRWKMSNANKEYRLCNTYPPLIAVPYDFPEEKLEECAKFRSRGRLPVLSWLHPTTGVCLCRSAQPSTALTHSSDADELLLKAIKDAGSIQAQNFYIVDARPLLNALGNKVKGGGYENTQTHYPFAKYCNFNIENIHAMRKSQKALFSLLQNLDNPNWYADFEKTEWLKHQFYILRGACQIVDYIETNKNNVLVHCSDGWDRTAQLTGLALLMLDPFYRTIRGFAILIEKEWISFGHKFLERYGLGRDINSDSGERSPVFPQFIECVYQLFKQFPTFFEFDERLLIFMIDHLYSNLFGTFLVNCWREREPSKTNSIWSYVLKYRDEFRNPFYNATTLTDRRVLMPVVSLRRLDFWRTYHLRPYVDNMYKELTFMRLSDLTAIKDHFEETAMNMADMSISSYTSASQRKDASSKITASVTSTPDSAQQKPTKMAYADQTHV